MGHINSLPAGLVVAALALPRGPIREHFGSWDRLVRWRYLQWSARVKMRIPPLRILPPSATATP